uniref:non-specific serine/threonine protein kinase n=1 Tax=Neobacillus citreus TaxID=2833578 RepID=A0A942SXW3_9BACI
MEERVFGGRYRVTGTLGHGGMASVYRAVDQLLGREVAIKLFRIGPVDHGERARAEAEIQVLAALRSPSLVTLYDAALDDADGDSYLVMELVPGSDLATRLREGTLDPVTAARVGAQVADGLATAHAQGIVHRDVKPANVLLETDGTHVKLADFGIALLRDSARVTGTGTVMGTAAYLAPEQVLAQGITGKADVYALGLVLLEALTGRQPFPGSAVESATARLTRGPEIDQHLPTAWRTLLHVMTAQDPADRPTAAEAAERLRALQRDDTAPATQLLPGGPGTRTAAAAGAAAGAAAAAAGAGAASADDATRVMPAAGASGQDDATQLLQSQPGNGGSDDVATTLLGTQSGGAVGGGAGAVGGGPVPPASPERTDEEPRKRRRGAVIAAVVVALLVIGGIVWALVAMNDDPDTPADTSTTSPGQQQTTEPEQQQTEDQQQPSQPTEQQPGQPEQQQPSQPTEQQPSEPAEEPSEEPSDPVEEPSVGPEPSSPASNPVQDPVDTGAASGGNDSAADDSGPGNSENAPGQQGKG